MTFLNSQLSVPSYTYAAVAALSLYLTYTLIPPRPLPNRLAKIEDADTEVDNTIYDSETWWDGNCTLTLLNSARCPWFVRVWGERLDRKFWSEEGGEKNGVGKENLEGKRRDLSGFEFLDVGCGGGIATEELARSTGASFTGIDLSGNSIKEAQQHCKDMGLRLQYVVGSAFDLPFPDASFHGIICSDVLEHLKDIPKALSEISRVLKPGGVFVYDTINRTWLSWFLAIVVTQQWMRFIPHGGHDWKLFITPGEMDITLEGAGLIACSEEDVVGMRPSVPSPLGVIKGIWAGRGLQSVLRDFVLTRSKGVNYLAWARKPRH